MASNKMEEEDLECAIDKMTIGDKKYDLDWLKGTSAESVINLDQNSIKPPDFSHPIYKTISKLNGKINSMSYLELSNSLKELKLDPRHVLFFFSNIKFLFKLFLFFQW
jgi:hypothetical protein